jgi:hypothetical protein
MAATLAILRHAQNRSQLLFQLSIQIKLIRRRQRGYLSQWAAQNACPDFAFVDRVYRGVAVPRVVYPHAHVHQGKRHVSFFYNASS